MTEPFGESTRKLRCLFGLLLLVQGAALASNKACSSGSGGSGCGAVDQAFTNLTPLAVGDPFSYSDFSSISGLTLNGTAAQSGSQLSLTNAGLSEAGSVFYTNPLAIDSATSVSTSFEFSICNGPSSPSCTSTQGDGLTFTFQNDPSGASALGGSGYQLGYGPISPSVAVAFDTYLVPGLLVLQNGDFNTPLAYDSSISFTPGNYFAWVTYDPVAHQLSVYVNTVDTQPGSPTLSANLSLSGALGSQTFVGFTGGTGSYDEDQNLLNWSFSDSEVAPEPGTMGFAVLGLSAAAFCLGRRATR